MATIFTISGYKTSRDYERLADAMQRQSIICVVDYGKDCRDVAHTLWSPSNDGNGVWQLSARGIGYIYAYWEANSPGGVQKTALEEALYTADVSEWDEQGREIDADDFAEGNDLFLIIHEDGEWEVEDRKLLADRLSFHLGERHPIVQALNA